MDLKSSQGQGRLSSQDSSGTDEIKEQKLEDGHLPSQDSFTGNELRLQHQNREGRITGGKYLELLQEDGISLADKRDDLNLLLDQDMPLTLTELGYDKDGKEIILLTFTTDDKENPLNWSSGQKFLQAILLCLMTLTIGLAATAYSSGLTRMVADLNTSLELGQLGLFTFNIANAIAPLFLAPFCELVGRRTVYIGAYVLFAVMFVGLALGRNIATILVSRTLSGLFGCVGTILVGGTFSDLYTNVDQAKAMAMFAWIAISSCVAAPVYCGFIDEKIGWRWIEAIQGLACVPLLVVVLFFMRETRGGVVLQNRAMIVRNITGDQRYRSPIELEKRTTKEMLHTSCVKAMHMLLTEPVVFFFGLWISFAWFLTFLFLSVIPITFIDKRGWTEGVAGLPYLSLCIGVTIGYLANFLQMRKYQAIVNSPDRNVVPEDRLYGAMFGSVFLPIGLFLYSFTQYADVHWIAPIISLAPIAVGIYFVFESTYSYTADCYCLSSSTAIAGQGLMRNTLGGVGPLFARQFFVNVGSQYAGLILALIASLLSLIPFVMFKYGHILRERSKLAKKY